MPRPRKPASPFRCFHSSPEVIRLVVMMYVRFPLSLRNVDDLLSERGIDICHETVRHWWNRFGPLFAKRSVLLRCRNRRPRSTIGVMSLGFSAPSFRALRPDQITEIGAVSCPAGSGLRWRKARLSPEFHPERRLTGRFRTQWVGRQTAKSAIKQLFELLLTKRWLVVAD